MKRYTIVLVGIAAICGGAFPQAQAWPGKSLFQKGVSAVLESFGWSVARKQSKDYKNPHHNSLTHRGWCLEDVLPEKIKGALRDGSFDGRISSSVLCVDKDVSSCKEMVAEFNKSPDPQREFSNNFKNCISKIGRDKGKLHTLNVVGQLVLGDKSIPEITLTRLPDVAEWCDSITSTHPYDIITVTCGSNAIKSEYPSGAKARIALQSMNNLTTLRPLPPDALITTMRNYIPLLVSGIGGSGFFGPYLEKELEEKYIQIPLGWSLRLYTGESARGNSFVVPLLARLFAIIDAYSIKEGGQGIASQQMVTESCVTFRPYVISTDKTGTIFSIEDQNGKRHDQRRYKFSRRQMLELLDRNLNTYVKNILKKRSNINIWNRDWKTHPLFKKSESEEWCSADEGGYFQGSFLFFQDEAHKHPEAKSFLIKWSQDMYRIAMDLLEAGGWKISSEVRKGNRDGEPDTVEIVPPGGSSANNSEKISDSIFAECFYYLFPFIYQKFKVVVPMSISMNEDFRCTLFHNERILTEQAFVDLNICCIDKASEKEMRYFFEGVEQFLFTSLGSSMKSKAKMISCCGRVFKNKEMQLSETVVAMMAQRRLDLDVLLEKALVPPVNNAGMDSQEPLSTMLISSANNEATDTNVQVIRKAPIDPSEDQGK